MMNLVGNIYGNLLVIEKLGRFNKTTIYKCSCNCGNIVNVRHGHLRNGHTKSCGCIHIKQLVERSLSHGMTNSRLYSIWCSIKSICNNPNVDNYFNYGGRGIKICKEWDSSFINFYNDMNDSYREGMEIDRIDVNGDYCKENCKWSSDYEQSRNKRNNSWLEANGEIKIKTDWAIELGIQRTSITKMMKKGVTFQEIYNKYSKK